MWDTEKERERERREKEREKDREIISGSGPLDILAACPQRRPRIFLQTLGVLKRARRHALLSVSVHCLQAATHPARHRGVMLTIYIIIMYHIKT